MSVTIDPFLASINMLGWLLQKGKTLHSALPSLLLPDFLILLVGHAFLLQPLKECLTLGSCGVIVNGMEAKRTALLSRLALQQSFTAEDGRC